MAEVLRITTPSPLKGIDSKAVKKFTEIKGRLLRMTRLGEVKEKRGG